MTLLDVPTRHMRALGGQHRRALRVSKESAGSIARVDWTAVLELLDRLMQRPPMRWRIAQRIRICVLPEKMGQTFRVMALDGFKQLCWHGLQVGHRVRGAQIRHMSPPLQIVPALAA